LAAILGGWLERAGPRKAGVYAALSWCGGLMISAIGVRTHQLWRLWIGSGVIGGIGLGLGYISPVSTLVKWFPDRRGMATGMAIMGHRLASRQSAHEPFQDSGFGGPRRSA
jgi:MFS family permease